MRIIASSPQASVTTLSAAKLERAVTYAIPFILALSTLSVKGKKASELIETSLSL